MPSNPSITGNELPHEGSDADRHDLGGRYAAHAPEATDAQRESTVDQKGIMSTSQTHPKAGSIHSATNPSSANKTPTERRPHHP